ncbi:MAG: hypothetical protein Q7S61_06180 [bacterium]|nr:hypothetical protein [bacterium]
MVSTLEVLLQASVIERIYTENQRHLFSVVPSVIPPEQIALPRSIRETAHSIAKNVITHGEPKFGPMWKQGYSVLPDGRIIFLQQSLSEPRARGALVIDILPVTTYSESIHIRYDFRGDVINTYETRQDGKLIIRYGIYDQPKNTTGAPTNLTLRDILVPVGQILQSVEVASNSIMWTKP